MRTMILRATRRRSPATGRRPWRSRGSVTAARGDLVDFENRVKAQSGKAVAKPAAQVLIADVEYVLAGLR